MDRMEDFQAPKKPENEFKNEFKEFLYFLNRQVFNQIPSVTAYVVQKALKSFREMQIELGESRATRLSDEKRAELQGKLIALEAAREAGILSWSEYRTKMANIYQPYVKKAGSKVEELIVSKVTA